jgi:hypothetical protein
VVALYALNLRFAALDERLDDLGESVGEVGEAQKASASASAAESAMLRKALVLSLGGKTPPEEVMAMLATDARVAAAFQRLKPGTYSAALVEFSALPNAQGNTQLARAYLEAKLSNPNVGEPERAEITEALRKATIKPP